MKIFKFHWKKCLFIALILFLSIRVFSQQVFMSGGNALNNYQFLSSDGVDWVVEGHFLWESIKDRQFPFELHVLRPPVYVIFTTLDAMLGGRGYVLSLISALSILITIYYSLKFIENKNHSLFVYLVTFILLILSPINYFRLFFQADPLATALSLAASWYVYKAISVGGVRRDYIVACILTTLAALTQTYGLIAPTIVFGMHTIITWYFPLIKRLRAEGKIFPLDKALKQGVLQSGRKSFVIVVAILSFCILKLSWINLVPHQSTPTNFGWLRFNFEMIQFYWATWGYYLSPIIFLIFGMCFWKKIRNYVSSDVVTQIMGVVVIVFMVLLFLYNWKDARFTYYFWPFLVIIFVRLSLVFKEKSRILNLCFLTLGSSFILLQTFHYYPQSYLSPNINNLNITAVKKTQSIIGRFKVSTPVDRLSLQKTCGDKVSICKDVKIPQGATAYRTKTFATYLKLNGISNPQKPQ
jgi:hypothetical protein